MERELKTGVCHITKKEYPYRELIPYSSIRRNLIHVIEKDCPNFSEQDHISYGALLEYRKKYLNSLIEKEYHELEILETEVVRAIEDNERLSDSMDIEEGAKLDFSQRWADKIAKFGGSWNFILIFFSFLLVWMAMNLVVFTARPFDPYPFILLNLILSCLAAIQAPIIMMSQNRKEEKDRLRSKHDYKVDLKAELEIRLLHEKMDHMIIHQNKRLIEIQELQLDYLDELILKQNNK